MANNLLTPKEQYKLEIVTKVINREIKPGHAALMLGISTRQIRRLRAAIQDGGSEAVVHGLRGKQGNHHINKTLKEKTLKIVKDDYSDFKPTFASEALADRNHIKVNPQTLRRWMAEYGLWKTQEQKKMEYRSWRPRKEYFGELVQFDGSYHHWFENRYRDESGNSIEMCLLAVIDDATGKITRAEFAENESILAVFNFWKGYILDIGKPLNIYLDKFSTYKINHKSAVDNHEFMTQFQRTMLDLRVNLISANSPQAKGRVERLFQTLQDRLVKEMRLFSINAPAEGSRFLKEVFLPKFNRRFSVIPAKEGNVHKALSEIDKKNLNRIFSVQSKRRVNNDFTIQFKNKWYQLVELQPTTVMARDKILAEEWLDGSIHFSLREKYLNYTILPARPKKIKQLPLILTTHKLNWKPASNHPWRKMFKQRS